MTKVLLLLVILLMIIPACEPIVQPVEPSPALVETALPTDTTAPTPIPPTPTPTEELIRVWFDPSLPEELLEEQLSGLVAQYGAEMVDSPLRFSYSS